MRVVKLKLGLLSVVAGTVIATGLMGMMNSAVEAAPFQVDAVKTEYLQQPMAVNGGDKKVRMFLRNVALRDLLSTLAARAGFNIMLDESIEGEISVDLNHVTINQALEIIKEYSNLVYMQDDKTLIVSTEGSALSQSINQQISQMIPVKYVNAKLIAAILNYTVFSGSGGEGSENDGKKASVEFRTNSVVITGTDNDVRLAEDLINKIDVPRESKTFKINHASVIEVTQLLQATIFNDGVSPFNASGNTDSGIPVQGTPITVLTETFEEGEGSSEVEGASGSSGGGSSQSFTLRTKSISEEEINISPDGPILVPDTRSNTITIMGTVEQIALAEAVIPTLDQKLPQVVLESSLIELDSDFLREMEGHWGQQSGQWRTGFNNEAVSQYDAGMPNAQPYGDINLIPENGGAPLTLKNAAGVLGNVIGLPTITNTGFVGGALNFTTAPIDQSLNFIYQINMMLTKKRGKLLANPSVLAMHNTEAIISITEEIVRRTTITRDSTGFVQTQVEIGEAGIVLNIVPKIGGDGFVTLRVRPSVSTVSDILVDAQNNITTLLRRKDFAVQEVRVADGQTLCLGGLIEETSSRSDSRIPGLGDLPILGALFRAGNRSRERTELLMLITPRIQEDMTPIVSSSFSQKPLVEIAKENGLKKEAKKVAPVPSAVEIKAEAKKVAPLKEQHNIQTIETPEVTYETRPLKTEKRVNAYTIDSVMKEFGINNVNVDTNKKYDKNQIDELLNEYLPQGSK